ncbi:TetR/AcrR family transcriptional regulator [Noviherbaspirillum saxi]|uniref:TetR/AcrR family transcriptional regulator n=1 Tax=Noviherbaspirillum saxi TaxID=2320863 RepID=A0A3A3FGF3_9BURK|nr:TetR/AcrR family transcriptional regulator [Noviherbaspirillum saxi]RJF92466.1 TetR/AcrR family transcriptional regulator [Noviherbaspirillum saxi]
MKTKSETKRQEILKAATEVFQEAGFERTSMEDIRKRAGFCKATLYSYFPSKEELFMEIVIDASEAHFQATLDALDPSYDDIKQALVGFGTRLLSLLYLTPVQAVRRLVVSEAGRSELGKKCYEVGPVRSVAAVADYLGKAMEKGKLRQANPQVAAVHLKGLLEAEWIDPFMFQVLEVPSSDELTASVERAVTVFMAAYGPLSSGTPSE